MQYRCFKTIRRSTTLRRRRGNASHEIEIPRASPYDNVKTITVEFPGSNEIRGGQAWSVWIPSCTCVSSSVCEFTTTFSREFDFGFSFYKQHSRCRLQDISILICPRNSPRTAITFELRICITVYFRTKKSDYFSPESSKYITVVHTLYIYIYILVRVYTRVPSSVFL